MNIIGCAFIALIISFLVFITSPGSTIVALVASIVAFIFVYPATVLVANSVRNALGRW